MTETPREIAHGKIIKTLWKHGVTDRAVVADLMPILDDFGTSRWNDALSYAVSLIRPIKSAIENADHFSVDVISDLTAKGGK